MICLASCPESPPPPPPAFSLTLIRLLCPIVAALEALMIMS